jgi:hypothetical protein
MLLSEEVLVTAFESKTKTGVPNWLSDDEALRLLGEAKPAVNIPMPEKGKLITAALDRWPSLDSKLKEPITQRAAELEKIHKRVRQAVGLRVRELAVRPQLPVDLLGILVLQPVTSE